MVLYHQAGIYMLWRVSYFPFSSNFAVLVRESGMQWSFSNKISGPTQYLSFRALEEDRQRKNVHDQLDLNQKSNANEAQVSFPQK